MLHTSQLDTRSMHVKLADFGLSRHFSVSEMYDGPTQSEFHARWTAPETVGRRDWQLSS